MRNPLNKRIVRELKSDFGKYAVIFLFMVLLISLVSGFLVADNSMQKAYYEGFEKYNLEYGHMTFDKLPEESLLQNIEKQGDITLYEMFYVNESYEEKNATIRVYKNRKEVNLPCLMEGAYPVSDTDIVIDRNFAKNNKLQVGDTLHLAGKELQICGLVALPDYSCLFENNSDMMFDSVYFSFALMTDAGYEALQSTHEEYNYAFLYNHVPADDKEEKKQSDDLLEAIKEIVKTYDEDLIQIQVDALTKRAEELQEKLMEAAALAMQGDLKAAGEVEDLKKELESLQDAEIDESNILKVTDYNPRYSNKAINFTGEDMGSDKAMITMFGYMVIVILCFVFAVTISNTIIKEAGVIGTLRASGFSKAEIVTHYMVLPVIVTIVAAIVGNVLGYTLMKNVVANLYYNSYSLCTYETLWNADAFVQTTLIPVCMMFVINLMVLVVKIQLSPLKFLRRELTRKKKKKAFHLSSKHIRFYNRFRLRILFQNIPAYITLFLGVFLAGAIAVFGSMFGPLLDDYADMVVESEICKYQYILKSAEETNLTGAEKYCVTALDMTKEGYMTDEITVYGIEDESIYVTADIPKGKVLISNGMAAKFQLKPGDKVTLEDPYTGTTYTFEVADEYRYDATLTVFVNREEFNHIFDKDEDYFTGYFTNEKITDIDDERVATIVAEEDLLKVTNQLKISMGEMMNLMNYFAVIMFLLMMYLMTKQIIEKNTVSISMTKILGFTAGEIGGLYLVITSVVIVASLLISIPLVNWALKWAFSDYLYTIMTGYVPFMIRSSVYVKMCAMGIGSYILVCIIIMRKINRIPKSDALKIVE